MNNLDLSIRYLSSNRLAVYIDDEPILLKQNRYGVYTYHLSTKKDHINLKVCTLHELEGKFWFIFSYIFFIISLLGIFNRKIDKKCLKINYESNLKLLENSNIEFDFTKYTNSNNESSLPKSNIEIDTIANNYYIDTKLKKRYKILKLAKIFTWIATLILIPIIILTIIS